MAPGDCICIYCISPRGSYCFNPWHCCRLGVHQLPDVQVLRIASSYLHRCCVTDRLFQLTWLSGKTYYYDVSDFSNFTMQNSPLSDGWGATTDGRHLIVSDGSATLTFLDPVTLGKVKSIVVSDNGSTVPMLNEVCHHKPKFSPVLSFCGASVKNLELHTKQ